MKIGPGGLPRPRFLHHGHTNSDALNVIGIISSLSKISKLHLNNKWVYKITSALGGRFGASKTSRGWFRAIGEKLVDFYIWDEAYIDGADNVFQYLEQYLILRHHP